MPSGTKRQQRTERIGCLDTGFGKVYLERRNGGPNIYARTHIKGGHAIYNTKKTNERDARVEAGWWFQDLYKQAQTETLHGHKFTDVAERCLYWLETTKRGEISDGQIRNYKQKWSVLNGSASDEPGTWADLFNDDLKIEDIDYTWLSQFRLVRKQWATNKRGTTITNATLRKDMLFFRLVFKYAIEVEKIIAKMPAFPEWRGTFAVAKNPTPHLSLGEYMMLVSVAKERMNEPDLNPRTRRQREELLMFVLISVCSALRVGEAESITWADCEKGKMTSGGEVLDCVRMWVFGKHGKAKNEREKAIGLYHAVEASDHLKAARPDAKPTDKLFLENHRDGLRDLYQSAGLWEVRRDNGTIAYRTAKSFRHTGISLWRAWSKNPDIDEIATWARTRRVHIEDWYNQNPVEKAVPNIVALRTPKRALP